VTSRANELKRRRESLLARVDAERRLLADQHARIAGGLIRADGWLTAARRVMPAAALGAVALGIVFGPGRIVRLLRAVAVPALLIGRLLGGSSADAQGGALRNALRFFGRRN
jgi:hypothetical protein